jgi:hypothetical protein
VLDITEGKDFVEDIGLKENDGAYWIIAWSMVIGLCITITYTKYLGRLGVGYTYTPVVLVLWYPTLEHGRA